MEFYKVQSIDEINSELILLLIERFKQNEVPRLQNLYQYYLGNSKIKSRPSVDATKPNNKIAHPIGNMITQSVIGFFLGKPISYSSDNDDFIMKVQDIYDKAHEQSHNVKIGKQLSIYGLGYELIYMNELNEVRLAVLNVEECFMIYDNSVEQNPLMAVRFYDVQNYLEDTVETFVELYSATSVQFLKIVDDELKLQEESPHYFGEIPIIQFFNNEDASGDYEKVLDLIDNFDQCISDNANDIELFADSYLVLSGMSGTDSEDINEMKMRRVMLLEEGGSAQWLTKSSANQGIEQHIDRLRQNIHQMSCIPNFADEKFSTAQSASALRYHLFGLETICSIKERYMELALEKRLKLVTNILNILGGNYNSTDIVMSFQRNIPTDYTLITDMVSKLHGIVSDKTLLSQISFIDDVNYELQLLKEQNQDSLYSTSDFTVTNPNDSTTVNDNTVV